MKTSVKMEFLFTESQPSRYCGFENLRMACPPSSELPQLNNSNV